MDEVYLISFKRDSADRTFREQVKQGALLALVFDPVNVGRHIGEKASERYQRLGYGKVPPVAARQIRALYKYGYSQENGYHYSCRTRKKGEKGISLKDEDILCGKGIKDSKN